MSLAAESTAGAAPLYPARVRPPAEPLKFGPFLKTFVKNPLAVMPEAVYREDIVSYRRAGRPICWVTSPELVKTVLLDRREEFSRTAIEKRVLGPMLGNGLLTSDGPEWRWQRQIAAPVFRHQELIGLVPAIVRCTEAKLDLFRSGEAGSVRPIEADMTDLTFDVICATLLPGGETHVKPKIAQANIDYLGPISWSMIYAILNAPSWLPHPGRARMRAAEHILRTSVGDFIAARRQEKVRPNDLLQRLIDARHPETGEGMSDEQLVDNLLTFFAAGHETTAKALTWTLYLLANAPEWEARLLAEIERVCGRGPVAPEHIDKLELTTQVLKESMRLYPPAPVISRVASQDTELGGKQIAAGTQVVIPIYAIQRHKARWEDPDRFDPTRFEKDKEAKLSRYQYMPFGAGPRICIGMAFAMIEAVAMLATLVRAARFETLAGHEPTPISRITLRPAGGMPMAVRMR
jgi:cytochrome P450